MRDKHTAQIIHTVDPSAVKRQTPAQAGGPIHTRRFSGRFRNLRLLGGGSLLLLFFGTAWLNWQGRQAVLWDLAERKFHIFGASYWPQDFALLAALLMIAAFGLFFITVLAGRVWCGYACPQSTWTWIFMWVENLTEGDRSQRIKLDAAPWSINKLGRRAAKHGLWAAISLATALTFVGYFTPIRELLTNLLNLQLDMQTAFWLGFFSVATYINAAWLREKVCLHMCPYSRFQSVMFDRHTLLVSYDAARGENRGPRRKDEDPREQSLGDCIDCTLCVQVCPTGIDIRDGLQLDCISCGACIDACDSIMDKMGYARGLIRYTSEEALAGGLSRWLRPSVMGYAAVLLAMVALFAWALAARPLLSLGVAKDRQLLFRDDGMGRIENIYTLKVINKSQESQRYTLKLRDAHRFQLQGPQQLRVAAGDILTIPVSVIDHAPGIPAPVQTLYFELKSVDIPTQRTVAHSTFVSPRTR